MFFAFTCLLMIILLSTGHTPDTSGWMMLLGLAWIAGYLDCRRFSRSDREKSRVTPPDIDEPIDDKTLFKS